MGRRKIEIRPIKDDRNRSVTFLKRKGGLFKKAHELSVLCSVDVAVFVFGNNKKLYEYSSADMSDLISRYQFHGGANEHKGPNDFNGGGDDDDDEDGDASPPQAQDAMDSQMMPPHYQGPQPPFPQIRHHTPSASPPIPNGGPFQGHPPPRGHTPQPSVNSRPGSRNDMRRGSGMMPQPVGHQPPPGGMNYMPTPPMYNQPHGQSNLMPHGPNYGYQQQPPPQSYAGDDRRPGPPAGYTSHPPPPPQSISVTAPPEASPQPPHQPLPMNPNVHISPPPQPDRRAHEPPPPAPMEPRTGQPERPPQPPLLNTDSAIKKMSRKSHSIFTPIEENRSILSQHLASFAAEPQGLKGDPSPPGAARAHSIDAAGPARNGAARGSPPHPPRPRSAQNGIDKKPEASALPENSPTPPSRSNSFKTGSSASANRTRGPRLKVQIPDGASDAGDATGESTTPKAHSDPSSSQMLQRHNSHSSIVLPPPSPSASALLSAGATGPPNPFARPPPQQAVNGDTPVSSLPSRFMNSEFLPSPSSFYHDWNFRGSDNNTLPSPLNFATPVVGSGPSFLRDDNSANHAHTSNAGPAASLTSAAAAGPGSGPAGESGPAKRKSPEVGSGGAADSHDMSSDPKRVKVD